MIIKTINPTNINRLRKAFEDVLLDNGIGYSKIGITEDGDELVFLLEKNDKFHTVKWDGKRCIDHDTAEIAKSVLEPIIPRLKGN